MSMRGRPELHTLLPPFNLFLIGLLYSFMFLNLHRRPGRRSRAVWWWMVIGIVLQGYHVTEHVVKLGQATQLDIWNGTGGIFGDGPGGWYPLMNAQKLHLIYNTIVTIPPLVAFLILAHVPGRKRSAQGAPQLDVAGAALPAR